MSYNRQSMTANPDENSVTAPTGLPYPTLRFPRVTVVTNGDTPSPACVGALRAHTPITLTTVEQLGEVLSQTDVLFVWPFSLPTLRFEWQEVAHLRWIHTATAGIDGVVFPELTQSNVLLTNSRGVFDDSIAEYVLGLILAFAKDFPRTLDLQRQRVWMHRDTERLAGQNVLVVGAGAIGRAIARLCRLANMTVELMGRRARGDAEFGEVLGASELYRALGRADFVVVAAPLTDATYNMFDVAAFNAMSAHARFINIGRGSIVDESALLRAIREGRLAAAALDVFVDEPLPDEHPFWSEERVIVSPHMSADFHGWQEVITDLFLQNLRRFRGGAPLLNIVDKALGLGFRENERTNDQ